jgi:hypothetical protein
MKQTVEPPAIVVQAECQIEAVSKAAKEIKADYLAAMKCRDESNRHGLGVGKRIIEACFDSDLVALLKRKNSKESMPTGGAPIKAHAWVAKEIARKGVMHEEYLTQCARTYLAALNKFLATDGKEPLSYIRGVFQGNLVKPLPGAEVLQAFVKVERPRIDELPESDVSESSAEDAIDPKRRVEEFISEVASALRRKMATTEVNLKSNRLARTKFRQAVNEVLSATDFAVQDLLVKGD